MNISEVASYAGMVALPLAVLAAMDNFVPATTRRRTGQILRSIMDAAIQPASWKYYFIVSFLSFLLTGIIILLIGGWEKYFDSQRMTLALKSTGLFFVALCLKIAIWDYLMALKSARIWNHPSNRLILKLFFVILDIFASVVLTFFFIHLFESAQADTNISKKLSETSAIQSFKELFNEFSLFSRALIERSLYLLNGTMIFYSGKFVEVLSCKFFDWNLIEEKPFITLSAILGVTCFVVLVLIYFYR